MHFLDIRRLDLYLITMINGSYILSFRGRVPAASQPKLSCRDPFAPYTLRTYTCQSYKIWGIEFLSLYHILFFPTIFFRSKSLSAFQHRSISQRTVGHYSKPLALLPLSVSNLLLLRYIAMAFTSILKTLKKKLGKKNVVVPVQPAGLHCAKRLSGRYLETVNVVGMALAFEMGRTKRSAARTNVEADKV